MIVVLTGASGFVGRAVLKRLSLKSICVRPVVRTESALEHLGLSPSDVGFVANLSMSTRWAEFLAGAQVVVHCAARVHIARDDAADPLVEYRRVNVEGTLNLARQAVAAGVRRMVFISSIGVNGSQTFGRPFTADDPAGPEDAYAQSKWEAERGLRALSTKTGLEVVIIRPPLVYGPEAPGNFGRLVAAVQAGKWLPLSEIDNRRSLVSLDNLTDLIVTCIRSRQAANQTFLVSDDEDLSTPDLVRRLGLVLGRRARLFPVPVGVIMAGARLIGRTNQACKVCGSLQVDISKTRELLGWTPPLSVDEGLRRLAQREN